MINKILVIAIVIFIFLCCAQKNGEVKVDESTGSALSHPDSLCIEKIKLAEAVLNQPDFIRYSRLRNVRKVFDTVYRF